MSECLSLRVGETRACRILEPVGIVGWSVSDRSVVQIVPDPRGFARVTGLRPGRASVSATVWDEAAKTYHGVTWIVVGNPAPRTRMQWDPPTDAGSWSWWGLPQWLAWSRRSEAAEPRR